MPLKQMPLLTFRLLSIAPGTVLTTPMGLIVYRISEHEFSFTWEGVTQLWSFPCEIKIPLSETILQPDRLFQES